MHGLDRMKPVVYLLFGLSLIFEFSETETTKEIEYANPEKSAIARIKKSAKGYEQKHTKNGDEYEDLLFLDPAILGILKQSKGPLSISKKQASGNEAQSDKNYAIAETQAIFSPGGKFGKGSSQDSSQGPIVQTQRQISGDEGQSKKDYADSDMKIIGQDSAGQQIIPQQESYVNGKGQLYPSQQVTSQIAQQEINQFPQPRSLGSQQESNPFQQQMVGQQERNPFQQQISHVEQQELNPFQQEKFSGSFPDTTKEISGIEGQLGKSFGDSQVAIPIVSQRDSTQLYSLPGSIIQNTKEASGSEAQSNKNYATRESTVVHGSTGTGTASQQEKDLYEKEWIPGSIIKKRKEASGSEGQSNKNYATKESTVVHGSTGTGTASQREKELFEKDWRHDSITTKTKDASESERLRQQENNLTDKKWIPVPDKHDKTLVIKGEVTDKTKIGEEKNIHVNGASNYSLEIDRNLKKEDVTTVQPVIIQPGPNGPPPMLPNTMAYNGSLPSTNENNEPNPTPQPAPPAGSTTPTPTPQPAPRSTSANPIPQPTPPETSTGSTPQPPLPLPSYTEIGPPLIVNPNMVNGGVMVSTNGMQGNGMMLVPNHGRVNGMMVQPGGLMVQPMVRKVKVVRGKLVGAVHPGYIQGQSYTQNGVLVKQGQPLRYGQAVPTPDSDLRIQVMSGEGEDKQTVEALGDPETETKKERGGFVGFLKKGARAVTNFFGKVVPGLGGSGGDEESNGQKKKKGILRSILGAFGY